MKRNILYNKKEAGGINLLNVHCKAISIFANTFLRLFISSEENETLVKYYCGLSLNPLFKIRELPDSVSISLTPYYTSVINTVRKCNKIKNFPNITSSNIYDDIKKNQSPLVGEKYPLFNWEKIWKNVAFKYISSDDRSVLFKYLHEILPNKLRLYNIKSSSTSN